MGYTTQFEGSFRITLPTEEKTIITHTNTLIDNISSEPALELINGLAGTRRMCRDLPTIFGTEGEFYFNNQDLENFGQNRDEDSILDYNKPPRTQPSLWLQWVVVKNEEFNEYTLEWDGGEKFYSYIEWLEYLIERILIPKGIKLNGVVSWYGEESDDVGTIVVKDNVLHLEAQGF